MANITAYKLVEACRAQGCPVCRVEQESVERYLTNQFYENVNSPKWRDQLRASVGFCHEHAWLAVDKRLGDALGFTIIYHDILNNLLRQTDDGSTGGEAGTQKSSLRRISEQARNMIEKMVNALTPRKPCPVCEHREDARRTIVAVLMDELKKTEMVNALQSSDGLCLPHLRLALEDVKDGSVAETLLKLQRGKLESLKTELAEFIRKSDYKLIEKGFGREGDAWLRALGMVVGHRRGK